MTRRLPFRPAFVLLLALIASPLAAQTPIATPVTETPSFAESACMYEPPTGLVEGDDVVCGWLTAPLWPDGSKPGTVRLPIVRVLATTDTPAAAPLVVLLGGPGQNMSAVLPLFGDELPIWRSLLERQDVILFDQRGMGLSTPSLACPFERPNDDGTMPDGNAGLEIFRCGAELQSEGIDPSAFTTEHNAADLEAMRVAMGYDQIDLYGISYGSKLALSAVRDYPESIRATIISSPLPLEQNPFADQTLGFDHALDQVWAACAADPVCAEANPDPAGDLVRAVNTLRLHPMNITAIDPVSGDPIELSIDHIQFMQVLYLSVFVGDFVPLVPYLVTSVAAGDDSILQMVAPTALVSTGLSLGALFTYFCQDEVPFSPASETKAALSGQDLPTPFRDGSWISLGDQAYTICRMWDLPAADGIEGEAVVSDAPLLIFTGAFDPITPASNGETVAMNFPNSQWVNFPAQGHDPASFVPDCANPIMLAFLDDPLAPVDASCADVPVTFPPPEPNATPVASPLAVSKVESN